MIFCEICKESAIGAQKREKSLQTGKNKESFKNEVGLKDG